MFSRREYLRATALVSVLGIAGLAGCTDGRAADRDKPRVPTEPDYQDWFEGVSNYEGTIDARSLDEVTVLVGTEGNLGRFAFGPPAMAVSPSTTVVWEWTGGGGGHNVVADDDAFDSGDVNSTEGHTYAHTFIDPGVYKYVCEPHETMGMRGAIVVAPGEVGT